MFKFNKGMMVSRILFLLILTILQMSPIEGENIIPIKAFNKELKENIFTANSSKLDEISSSYNNELVSYNQLLPYLESKLPIPISLINQLRKYRINQNMLNKIHSYNLLRRQLHGKLIDNEIDGMKYSEILSEKFKTMFKNINQEEKKNFLSLVNYLKMFNFDNKKLYNALHDGNALLKLINENKMKYLPFENSDKKLPDIFVNNKINQEIKRILIQYKISSQDLYNKLANKISPLLLEDMNKNSQLVEPVSKNVIKDIETNNPYDDLKARIEDLTSFNKKPKILPLNEPIQINKMNLNVETKNTKQTQKKIDESLNKYIRDLTLLNAIEKERDSILNTKMDDLNQPKNKIAIGVKPNPLVELLALYLALSIPGILPVSKNFYTDTVKKLPYIKRTKEEILQHSHVEGSKLYDYLINKNVKESFKKIRNIATKEKSLNHLDGLNNELKKFKELKNNHDFDRFVQGDNYYDAPRIPDYDRRPVDYEDMKINGHKLFAALESKNKVNKLNKDNENYKIEGNKLFHHLRKTKSEKKIINQEDRGIDGHNLANLIGMHRLQNDMKKENKIQNIAVKLDGTELFNKLSERHIPRNKMTNNEVPSVAVNKKEGDNDLIDGKILQKLLQNEPMPSKNMKSNENNEIKGDHLFNILSPIDSKEFDKINQKNQNSKINLNKFYKKLYKEFSKNNQGVLNVLHDKNKMQWKDQNVEIPNISSLEMNDSTRQKVIKAEHTNNDKESNEGKYNMKYGRTQVKDELQNENGYFRGILDYLVFGNVSIDKRPRRSINNFNNFENNDQERQVTLNFVLNKILREFEITRTGGKTILSTEKIPTFDSSILLTQDNDSNTPTMHTSGFTTDFMFSKDADIEYCDQCLPTTRSKTTIIKSTTPKLTLMDVQKPKVLNKDFLLLRIQQYKKPFDLNYTYFYRNNHIKEAIIRLPVKPLLKIQNNSQENNQNLNIKNKFDDFSISTTMDYLKLKEYFGHISTQTETLETFRAYSTLHRSNRKENMKNSKCSKSDNKTLIARRLLDNMLPNIEEYQSRTHIEEINNTVIMHLSDKDKVIGAEYVDDLISLYPDDPDILHKKFNKDKLEKQLAGYNKIFDQLSEETKRKYYITLDIFSRMHHIEQTRFGKIVINNVHTETPSSDEIKILYDEFSHESDTT